ncbi:MAG: metalloregulator ArsR/SmtB family transcription factor, partial [Oscillospiraceae bacterium]|nr:metalloregulator ArsR/SmtB family transcription factor [Oscillospiraceae bacterium]
MGDETAVSGTFSSLFSKTRECSSILPKENFSNVADLFRVLGDATRIHIMHLLLKNDELCVQELAEQTQMNASAVSHHLRTLRQENLVKQRRSGKNVFYRTSDTHVLEIIQLAMIHANH